MTTVTRTFDEDTPLLTARDAAEWLEDANCRYPNCMHGDATDPHTVPVIRAIREIAEGRAVVRPVGEAPGAESEVVRLSRANQPAGRGLPDVWPTPLEDKVHALEDELDRLDSRLDLSNGELHAKTQSIARKLFALIAAGDTPGAESEVALPDGPIPWATHSTCGNTLHSNGGRWFCPKCSTALSGASGTEKVK